MQLEVTGRTGVMGEKKSINELTMTSTLKNQNQRGKIACTKRNEGLQDCMDS